MHNICLHANLKQIRLNKFDAFKHSQKHKKNFNIDWLKKTSILFIITYYLYCINV